jgi:hypothetical protein
MRVIVKDRLRMIRGKHRLEFSWSGYSSKTTKLICMSTENLRLGKKGKFSNSS